MKKIIITFSLLVFSFLLNTTNAASIPALGASTTSQYAGKVVFPVSTSSYSGVYVNTDAFILDDTKDIQISGYFWMSNLASTDPTLGSLGWAYFSPILLKDSSNNDIPNSKVVLQNNGDNTFTFSGYAWSKAAGWIYFSPTNLITGDNRSKVIYDRGNGIFSGCAWSQNIGWVCFDGITLDTTPPHFPGSTGLSMVTQADDYKLITLNEASTGKIQNWDSTAKSDFTTDALFKFNHNMKNAGPFPSTSRDYDIEASDIYGNTATGKIKIVANIPDPISYNGTLGSEKIADGYDKHIIDIKLRDAYDNPVVSISNIKKVEVTIGFSGDLDLNQIDNYDFGDAVTLDGGTDFSELIYQIGNASDTGSISDIDGNYKVEFTSLAPSKTGYSDTSSGNDIQVNNLDIVITALNGNSGVGEGPINNIHTSFYSTPYKFTPAIKIDGVSNNNGWKIYRDVETEFTITGSTNKTTGSDELTDIHITHLFDTMSGSTYTNNQISYQNLTGSINQTTCTGSNTSTGYYSSHPDCVRSSPYSSITIKSYDPVTSTTSSISSIVTTIPRLVNAGLSSFDTKYSSIISYSIDGINIKYPSYTTTSSLINNSQIKISGLVNKNNNNFAVVADSSINYIGSILKSDVYTMIHKNVSIYQKAGTGTSDTLYMTGNYSLNSWPTGVETIIVDGEDITINTDIYKTSGKVKTIIALKKSDGTMGNIWIKNGVQFVGATLIADRSVISGDGTTYYTDTNSAIRQLFIKGSVISYNTIGGSSRTPVICPFYLTTVCDLNEAKRYDFNHFRSYINGLPSYTAVPGLNTSIAGYANAPMIIEYDSDTQKNPPKIIKK